MPQSTSKPILSFPEMIAFICFISCAHLLYSTKCCNMTVYPHLNFSLNSSLLGHRIHLSLEYIPPPHPPTPTPPEKHNGVTNPLGVDLVKLWTHNFKRKYNPLWKIHDIHANLVMIVACTLGLRCRHDNYHFILATPHTPTCVIVGNVRLSFCKSRNITK